MLVHRTLVTLADPFDLAAVKLHLRVDHTEEDAAIQNMARTAAAQIEQFAQIALLTQTVRLTIFDPNTAESYLHLPIGPADAAPAVSLDGSVFSDFDFADGLRPALRWGDGFPDLTPSVMSVTYSAGFGSDHTSIPPDLLQAIMDQTALHYDGRSPMDSRSLPTSPHMARIGARYRGVQV